MNIIKINDSNVSVSDGDDCTIKIFDNFKSKDINKVTFILPVPEPPSLFDIISVFFYINQKNI